MADKMSRSLGPLPSVNDTTSETMYKLGQIESSFYIWDQVREMDVYKRTTLNTHTSTTPKQSFN